MAENPAVETRAEGAAPQAAAGRPATVIRPDLDFIRDVLAAGGGDLKKCYQCATCSVVCKLSSEDAVFPRKEMLWAQWGLKDRLLADPDLFLCYQCNDCSVQCPRGARPGDVLAAIRNAVYQRNAVPAFMGKALGDPDSMLPLFLVPILVLGTLLFVQHAGYTGEAGSGFLAGLRHVFGEHVHYHSFLKHGLLEMLFIGGNVLIFALAALGFVRFYRSLQAAHDGPVQKGFLPAAVETIREIVAHKRFNSCGQNRPRAVAHLLTLFGFLGAAATAGLALIYMMIWLSQHPGVDFPGLGLTNPIKWLGVGSGLAMIAGTGWMWLRRATNADGVGANGFGDKLFLTMILLVAVTGMATWLLRLADIAAVAYPVYFVHLVLVFFLLWYMPYSKFAHMIYRSLALIWANQTGRIKR